MKWFFKLSRKDRLLLGVMAAAALLVVTLIAVMLIRSRQGVAVDDTSEPDAEEYMLYLDFGTDFRYTYSMEFQRNTSDDGRIVFTIPKGETAVFTVVPSEGKLLKDVSIKAGTEKVRYKREDNDISFTMPAHSVSVSPIIETDTSYNTPTPGPQSVKVEGVTPELEGLMHGQYNEELLLDNLRTALSLDNANSSYKDVSVFSFTGETVDLGIDNTVGMIAILNHTTTRKVLVSYNISSNVYSFTLNYVPTAAPVSAGASSVPAKTATPVPTKAPTPRPTPTDTPVPAVNNGSTGSAFGTGNGTGGYGTQGGDEVPVTGEENGTPTVEEFVSRFSLYDYPESFSSYVGGEEAFFNALFDYVYSMDPNITSGTFDGFSIDGNYIKFTVSLSNGDSVSGTYDRELNVFYF